MATTAVIVHQLPGRLRLRFRERRGDAEYLSSLSENLAADGGVDHVKVNASTGSMVIEFSDTVENLVQRLQQKDVVLAKPSTTGDLDERRKKPSGNDSAAPFHLVSDRDINPMFMLGTLLAAAGLVQTFRGKILVPSLSLLWYAIEAFRQSGKLREATTKGHEGR